MTDLFATAEKRLAWASGRQAVLARNLANIDTPGFQARDAGDFRKTLAGTTALRPARTAPNHLTGTIDPGLALTAADEKPWTADKNGVRLEDQLMKVADTQTIHSTVTAIYKKYTAMFTMALGKAG